jgi:hypothetical protein
VQQANIYVVWHLWNDEQSKINYKKGRFGGLGKSISQMASLVHAGHCHCAPYFEGSSAPKSSILPPNV